MLEKIADDVSINFRPSPNFKHMKKYLKSKFEEEESSGASTLNQKIELELTKEGDNKAKNNVAVQPPLPPGTPPPNFVMKEEVIDDESNNNNSQQQNDARFRYDKPNAAQTDATDNPKKDMCKDFVRGKCKRTHCNYSHELDLTQLKGVYKFCRDFANGRCKRPVCIFVHASTFEKENFFRTGVLPPHTLSHLKDFPQQPQPVSEAPAQQCMPIYQVTSGPPANPTYSEYNSCAPPSWSAAMTVPPVPPVAPAGPGMYNMFTQPQQPPPKHIWNEGNGVANNAEELPKKCINCKLAEISNRHLKTKLESIEKSTQNLNENIVILDQKKAKLMAILAMMLCQDNVPISVRVQV